MAWARGPASKNPGLCADFFCAERSWHAQGVVSGPVCVFCLFLYEELRAHANYRRVTFWKVAKEMFF